MKRAVTMGNFDGCHLGHQALFRTLKAVAEVNHLQPTVISFEPHSNYVLHGPGDPLLLTTTEEKREFVESLGIEFLVLPFTHELARLPFDKFVRTELIEKREVVSMFFGHDHCFGAGGKGNYETITAAFPELSTQMLSMVLHKGERVSSSAVRNARTAMWIERRRIWAARIACLERSWSASALVIRSDSRRRMCRWNSTSSCRKAACMSQAQDSRTVAFTALS